MFETLPNDVIRVILQFSPKSQLVFVSKHLYSFLDSDVIVDALLEKKKNSMSHYGAITSCTLQEEAYFHAIRCNKQDIVHAILARSVITANCSNNYAINVATRTNNVDLVQFVLDLPNAPSVSSWCHAFCDLVERNKLTMAQFLIDRGFRKSYISDDDWTYLQYVCNLSEQKKKFVKNMP
jgi:hypothetical protein